MRRSRATWCWAGTPASRRPDLMVCVVDATNLRLNLRLVLELKRLGLPMMRRAEHERRRAASAASRSIVARLAARARRAGGRDRRGAARRRTRSCSTRMRRASARRARRRVAAPPAATAPSTIEADAARGAPHPRRRRLPRAAAQRALRRASTRSCCIRSRACCCWRVRAVPDVPGRVQLGAGAHGLHQGGVWRALGEWLGRRMRRGPAAQPAGRRRHRRRRQRARVPAADPDPVPLHPGARGLRLPAARRLPARPPDGQRGPLRPRLHSAAVELRLRDPRHHGRRAPSRTSATAWRRS